LISGDIIREHERDPISGQPVISARLMDQIMHISDELKVEGNTNKQ
jgi:hypothetical protein